jgi:hypothetical protein
MYVYTHTYTLNIEDFPPLLFKEIWLQINQKIYRSSATKSETKINKTVVKDLLVRTPAIAAELNL